MKAIFSLIFVSIAFLIAGCNTVKGAGQDIQKAGSVIEGAARK